MKALYLFGSKVMAKVKFCQKYVKSQGQFHEVKKIWSCHK